MNPRAGRRGRAHVWRPRTALSYTFTQRNRNVSAFYAAFKLARTIFPERRDLRVLQVGPGAILGRQPGVRLDGWWGRKSESLARKLPLPETAYVSYEPTELIGIGRGHDFELSLSIVDFSAKVLAIASAAVESPTERLRLIQWDVTQPAPCFEKQYDLIVCCNVLVHVHEHKSWNQACDNIVSWGAADCVVVTDDDNMMRDRSEFASPSKRVYVRSEAISTETIFSVQ